MNREKKKNTVVHPMMEEKKKITVGLAYHKTEANVFHSRRWVMDTVKINDNFAGYPSINIPSTTFAPESSDSTLYTYGINGSLRSKGNEYYLFNAFDQMKAYSNKGKTYSYYGYDDAGQRMYKATLNNTISRTNTIEGAVWEVEKLMLYPNGYININQDGNYTKHYYVDDQRIASKIGSGFSNSISDGTVQNNSVFASMEEELGKVFILNDTMSNIYYPFDTITKLNGSDPEGIEDELYFYHGNHLSSTQMITDITGSITQQILYAPFGEIITEYNVYWKLDTIPSFCFNGKQFDEETGMYYYETRYYNPPTFIARDPHFEKYPFMSPYFYCFNNPLKFIDPTGMEGEVTDLIAADKTKKTNHTEQLTQSLSAITGLNVTTETRKDGRTFLSYAKDADGNPVINTDENGNSTGSETARGMLQNLIDNKEQVINIGRTDGKGSRGGGNEIGLDVRQIQKFMNGVQGGLNTETMGYGMVFLHEFLHTELGGGLLDKDVVPKMNMVRNQLGANFGQRMSYEATSLGEYNYIPFDRGALGYLRKGVSPGRFNMFIRY